VKTNTIDFYHLYNYVGMKQQEVSTN